MIPFFDLTAPCISCYSQRGYDQDPVGFEAVEQEFPNVKHVMIHVNPLEEQAD